MIISEKFEELSRRVWIDMQNASHYGTFWGEETITDLLLLELARANFANIGIIQTPKPKEAIQGTDWEWYVGSSKYGWVRYAIQAKKLNIKSSKYDSINHKVGSPPNDDYQTKILREFSTSNGHIPLYNFYNYYPLSIKSKHWHCNREFDLELLGWTFTTLKNIESAIKTRGHRSFDKLHSHIDTLPIRCIFSCPIFLSLYFNTKQTEGSSIFLGESFRKVQDLPEQIVIGRESGVLRSFPEELYNSQIGIYPERIAIIDLSENLNFKQEF